jgi:beta-lactamase class A
VIRLPTLLSAYSLIVLPMLAAIQPTPALVREDIELKIEQLINGAGGATVAVALHDMASGKELLINSEISFHPASTMKVPVMMEVYRQAAEGRFSLDDKSPIKNDFISIADGSHYSLSSKDDSEHGLYKRVGKTVSIRTLVKLMITVSSNLATNILVEKVSADRINDLMRVLDTEEVKVLRGVEDGPAFARGMNNAATARGLMKLLIALEEKRVVSPQASEEMIQTLLGQKHNKAIPAGLPHGTPVAHKTGWNQGMDHDAGIIYPPGRKPYVLVVLTRGIEEEKRSKKLIATISKTIFSSIAHGEQP